MVEKPDMAGKTRHGSGGRDMEWIGEETESRSVLERSFAVECDGRRVPGVVWTPAGQSAPRPLVLIGHGGGGHKREDHILALARRLVRHHGIAAAAIDGPVHGDRRPADLPEDREQVRARLVPREVTDRMIGDWKATLDALQKVDDIGTGKIGYWGLSMGTLFGLPFVAAEPRIAGAVLGLMGTGMLTGERLAEDAPEVRCPVLFLQQWNDELIPRERGFELFERLGSSDKRLHAHPGAHSAVPPEEFAHTEAFFARHLLD
jgi:dienelactone hydrolase